MRLLRELSLPKYVELANGITVALLAAALVTALAE